MQKAFTMIELVFVIVIVGILSFVAASSFQRNVLQEAADQLVSHIRYTQHLAMMDDKFDANETQWFMRRWTLRFQQNLVYTTLVPHNTYNGVWAYTIFSDLPNFSQHVPDLAGMAKNPENPNQYLSGGYDNVLHVDDATAMKSLRLKDKYGVEDIVFGGGCRSNVLYIHFDYLGRPMNSFPTTHPYELPAAGWHKLLTSPCQITLCNDDCSVATSSRITVLIEPETGYTHIQ
ncbi:MAG: type II secretion system protein [Campylobacteraceae bacterium]|nr:type II secretion system protein [Campylobacteraceae bacterium]